jgi:hypothetical protein
LLLLPLLLLLRDEVAALCFRSEAMVADTPAAFR